MTPVERGTVPASALTAAWREHHRVRAKLEAENTLLIERLAELASEAVDIEEAIQKHHDLRYSSGHGAKPVFAPHDLALYTAAGIAYNRPEPWQPSPDQRAIWRRDPDAAARERALIDAGEVDPVRVSDMPEQPHEVAV